MSAAFTKIHKFTTDSTKDSNTKSFVKFGPSLVYGLVKLKSFKMCKSVEHFRFYY